jgi:hypothetical protein
MDKTLNYPEENGEGRAIPGVWQAGREGTVDFQGINQN